MTSTRTQTATSRSAGGTSAATALSCALGRPTTTGTKKYGPRRDYGEYVHTGDTVGVVMDTAKGELSLVVDGVNLGVAFDGIPLGKPLVPCAILRFECDAVEIIF